MKIVALSDTHGSHNRLTIPECDLLIHCGDFSNDGREVDFHSFISWFSNLDQARNKVFIAGNHDINIQKDQYLRNQVSNGVMYLQDQDVTIDGLKIYGTPWTPFFYDWAWNGLESKPGEGYNYEGGPGSYAVPDDDHPLLVDVYDKIPLDTDILVCHGPPHGILDQNTRDRRCGSFEMKARIPKLKNLKHMFFGHLHFSGGMSETVNGIQYHNCASLWEDYKKLNKMIEVTV
jgi:Icc-related predicted phosphoesterase